jgi:hypothetical protein
MEEISLDKAAEHLYLMLDNVGGNPADLPYALQPIAVLYTAQAMIDNGGFRYLFEGDFPSSPPYSFFSDAYRRIGATDVADRLDRAVSFFPFPRPEANLQARIEFMESLDESSELFSLGMAVCGDERVWVLMEEYVKQNAAAFL